MAGGPSASAVSPPVFQASPSVLGSTLKNVRLAGLDAVDNGRGPDHPSPAGDACSGAHGQYQQAVHADAQQHAVGLLKAGHASDKAALKGLPPAIMRLQGAGRPFGARVVNQVTVMGTVHKAIMAHEATLERQQVDGNAAVAPRLVALRAAAAGLETALFEVAGRAAACKAGADDGFDHGCKASEALFNAIGAADHALDGCRQALGDQALVESTVHGVVAPHLRDSAQARLLGTFTGGLRQIHADDVLQKEYASAAGLAVGALLKSQDAEEFKSAIFHMLKLPEYVVAGCLNGSDDPGAPDRPDGPATPVPPGPAGPHAPGTPAGAPVAYARSGDVTGGDNYNYTDLGALEKLLDARQDRLPGGNLRDLLGDVYNRARADGETIGRQAARIEDLERRLGAGDRLPAHPPVGAVQQEITRENSPALRVMHTVENTVTTVRRTGPAVPPKPRKPDPLPATLARPPVTGTHDTQWRDYVGALNTANQHAQINADNGAGVQANPGDRVAVHGQGPAAGSGVAKTEVVLTQAFASDLRAFARGPQSAAEPAAGSARMAGAPMRNAAVAGAGTVLPATDLAEWRDTVQRLENNGLQAGSTKDAITPTVTEIMVHRDAVLHGGRPTGTDAVLPAPSPGSPDVSSERAAVARPAAIDQSAATLPMREVEVAAGRAPTRRVQEASMVAPDRTAIQAASDMVNALLVQRQADHARQPAPPTPAFVRAIPATSNRPESSIPPPPPLPLPLPPLPSDDVLRTASNSAARSTFVRGPLHPGPATHAPARGPVAP